MSYSTVAEMHIDTALLGRCSAAAASEVSAGTAPGDATNVGQWTTQRSWDLAATPGWAAQWESAVAGGIANPGASDAVITDGDILGRVQQLLALYPLPDTPPI